VFGLLLPHYRGKLALGRRLLNPAAGLCMHRRDCHNLARG
jgi:hypothetical protein